MGGGAGHRRPAHAGRGARRRGGGERLSGGDWPDLRASYERVAADYAARFDDELDRKPADRALLDRFAAAVAARGPVVDLGSGPGHVGAYLAARGATVVALDLSPKMLRECRARHPELHRVAGNLLALPLRDGCTAGAVGFYSYIHLRRDQLAAGLAELRRVLAADAPALLAVHLGTGEVRQDELLGHRTPFAATRFEPDEVAAAARAAGFGVRATHARAPYPEEHPTRRGYLWLTR